MRRVEHDGEVTSGECAGTVADVLRGADQLDLRMVVECLDELRKPVTGARDVQAHALAPVGVVELVRHQRPPPLQNQYLPRRIPSQTTVSIDSRLSALSVASTGERRSRFQSPFFIVKKSFWAWASVTATWTW